MSQDSRSIPRAATGIAIAGLLLVSVSPPRAHAHGAPHEHEDVVSQHLLPAPAAKPAPLPFRAQAQKRLYIGNDDHTDYMWSGTDLAYRGAFQTMLDYYMAQAESTASGPFDARGRFNCDGNLWVREYEANRTPAEFQRLIAHLRAGDLTMPLNTLVQLYGAMPAEAVLRSFYYAGRLERRENLRFPLVVPQEDQTLPGGVASLWAGAGARWSWKGICRCATQIDAGNRPRDIYRFAGPDGQSVVMKWNGFFANQSLGSYSEAHDPVAAVNLMDSDPTFLARWPWPVAAAFGYGGDAFETMTDAFVQASRNLSDTTRRVIVSDELDFFQDFESAYGDQLGNFSGSFGNEWDLYTASMGELTASFKREVERLRTAEALATIAALDDSNFLIPYRSARDSAFMACGLYYEHSWTADGVIQRGDRADWQRRIEQAMADYVETLYADALARLASRVSQPSGVERHLVFNPLSWPRTDFADLDVVMQPPFHVVDVQGELTVPGQIVIVNGRSRVRILASGVPRVGYRVFEVRPGAGFAYPPSASVTLPSFDNGLYRVTLGARGEIASVLDHKDGNRQLVAPSSALHDLGSGSGTVTLESAGPVSTTLRVVAGGSPAHQTRVTLYAGVDRIDVEGRVTENFGTNVASDWSFNLPGVTLRHEEVGMIAKVARQADGGDYADQNARTDWLTFNHFVDLSQDVRGVTLSNWDSPFFQPGGSSPTTLDAQTPEIHAVVGMQVDGPDLGIRDQGGDTLFLDRFALRTHGPYDPAPAMRFALEHQNPLVAARLTGDVSAPMPEFEWSLISIGSPDVLLWALKPAEEGIGQGVIARVWNLSDSPRPLSLTLPPLGILAARNTTHIETDLGPATLTAGALTDNLARQQLKTYRLFPGPAVGRVPGPVEQPLALAVFPNPARAGEGSTIAFTLPRVGRVRVTLHDLSGARVATVFEGDESAGRQLVSWDGRGSRGARLAAGVYFIRLEVRGRIETRRVVLLR